MTERLHRPNEPSNHRKIKKRLSEKGRPMISTKDMLNTLIGTKHFKKSIADSRKSDEPFVDTHRPLIVYPDLMRKSTKISRLQRTERSTQKEYADRGKEN